MAKKIKYTDKQGNAVTLEELLKGKSPEQTKAIKFFHGIPIKEGCFKKEYLKGEAYLQIVKEKQGKIDLKERALQKLGVDEDQVREIEPVCLVGFRDDHSKIKSYPGYFVGGTLVSSVYEVTWIFFGDDQVYVYNHAFDTTDESLVDATREYFYKDITAFATSSNSIQKKVWVVKEQGCSTSRVSEMRMMNSELFRIVVPGEVFECAYRDQGHSAEMISAMKQKLRDKKQQ